MVQGLGFRVWGLGFRVWGLGFGVWDFGCSVSGLRGTFQTLGILEKDGAEPSLEHNGGLHLHGSTGRNFHEKLWPQGGGVGRGLKQELRSCFLGGVQPGS